MKYPLPHGYEIHSDRSHRTDSTLRCRDSLDRCRDTRLPRLPGHSKRTIPYQVFFVDRHNGYRDKATLYIGLRTIGKTQLPMTSTRPRSKRKTLDDSFFIPPEHRYRYHASRLNCPIDCVPNSQTQPVYNQLSAAT